MKQQKIDSFRRFVIPKIYFDELHLYVGQTMEITIEHGNICMKPFYMESIKSRPFIGMVRRIDHLHRIVIPAEYMNVVGFLTMKKYDITKENEKIIISESILK